MTSSEPQTRAESSALLFYPALLAIYASLISIYLIARFALVGEHWPTRHDLMLLSPWAVIGTIGLLISSFTMFRVTRCQSSDRLQSARRWLLLTLLLGIGFAIFQVSEYRRRWLDSLIPAPFTDSLHSRANLYYLSDVQQQLIQLATDINTSKVKQNQLVARLQNLPDDRQADRFRLDAELQRFQAEESQRAERLTVINRLLTSEAKWTASVIATVDDIVTQRLAIAALAYDIRPHRSFFASHQQFRQLEARRLVESLADAHKNLLAAEATAKENSEPIKELLRAVAEVKSEQAKLESQLTAYIRQRIIDEDLDELPEQDNDPKRVALERQLAEVRERLEERDAKLSAAAKLVTVAEDHASRLSQELRSMAARQAIIAEMDASVGLNQQYPWLQLPICIPGGTAWAWTYFILTITHTIHLIYVLTLTVLLTIVWQDVNRDGSPREKHIARCWHTMVTVWCVLFVLIYLV